MADHPFDWTAAFLAALREWPVLAHASRAVGIDRSTAWRRMQADKAFAEAVQAAMEEGVDRAEQAAFQRGVVGVEEPVVYQGQLTPVWERNADGEVVTRIVKRTASVPTKDGKGYEEKEVEDRVPVQARHADGSLKWLTVRKPSDMLLAKVLSARRASYRTQATELTSPDGSMSPVDAGTRDARIAQLLEAARRRREAAGDDFSDLA